MMKVLVTQEIPETGMDPLKGLEVEVLSGQPPNREKLLRSVQGVNGILSTPTEKIDAQLMDSAGEGLRVVANMAVGYDNVDLETATERGIVVTNTPGVLDETTADTAFMLLMAAARRLCEAERLLRKGEFRGWGPKMLLGPDVWGKKLGVLGIGRIGAALARRASGFKMEVCYHDQYRNETIERELGAKYLELDELLETSDFVSVHTPLTPETHHLIGERELALMHSRAVLVNAARGPIVDEAALADALEARRIFAAGLDVYENEPEVHPKFLELENVVLAPHIGSASIETRDRMARMAAENLHAVLRGEHPQTPVNTEVLETP